MVSVVILFFIVFLACRFRHDASLVSLFFFILPLHYFLKQVCLFGGGVGLFPLWRECILIILLCRIIFHRHFRVKKSYILLLVAVFINSLPFFLETYGKIDRAINDFRDSITVFIFFVLCSSTLFSQSDLKRLFNSQLIVYSFLALSGIFQMFVMSGPMHAFMGHYELGTTDFLTNSFTILGFERMCGFSSSPNILGMTLAMLDVCIIIHCMNMKVKYGEWNMKMICLACVFLVFVLFTFCRAAWAIILGAILVASYMLKRYVNLLKTIVLSSVFVISTIVIISFFSEKVLKVIDTTLSGKEDSSAMRSTNVNEAWDVVLKSPYGHGMSSGIIYEDFMTESGWAIYAYEVGLFGLFLFLLTFVFVLKDVYRQRKFMFVYLSFPMCLVSMLAAFPTLGPMYMPESYMIWGMLGLAVNKNVCVSYERVL